MIVPLTAACIAGAAVAYHIAEPVLWTILKAEGGRVGFCTTQVNGKHDCGPAQVNAEIWVPQLSQLLGLSVPAVFYALRDNGCFNVYAEAYIVTIKVAEAKGDMWDGLGRYNSATPSLKHAYQQRLVEAYKQLFLPRQ